MSITSFGKSTAGPVILKAWDVRITGLGGRSADFNRRDYQIRVECPIEAFRIAKEAFEKEQEEYKSPFKFISAQIVSGTEVQILNPEIRQ